MTDIEYNFCTQCGEKVAKGSFFCTACGHRLSTDDIPTTDGIYEKIKDKKGISRGEKTAVSIAILIPLIVAITVFCIVYIPKAEIKNTYADLKEAMHIGDKGLYEVEDLLEKLPDDYKDVKKIRYEYEEIAANVYLISNEELTSKGASLSRLIFQRLKEMEAKNTDWQITDYILKRYPEQFIFGQDWDGENEYFIWYYDQRDGYDYLMTSLPGDMEDADPSTYYYERTDFGLILGYTDRKTGEKIAQYEIISLKYTDDWYMEVYCYADDTVYAFEPY